MGNPNKIEEEKGSIANPNRNQTSNLERGVLIKFFNGFSFRDGVQRSVLSIEKLRDSCEIRAISSFRDGDEIFLYPRFSGPFLSLGVSTESDERV
ncbi:hypothetical protein QL285_018045 [Trifolium repens]|jgi:hypothetical protein|nr:hypothetical protein QL285_018045 [Trifolium repens]